MSSSSSSLTLLFLGGILSVLRPVGCEHPRGLPKPGLSWQLTSLAVGGVRLGLPMSFVGWWLSSVEPGDYPRWLVLVSGVAWQLASLASVGTRHGLAASLLS